MFINSLQKLKLGVNFKHLKIKPGSIILISRYNNFLIKSDNYGIKLNTLNLKKLKENRGSLPFLKMLRKSSRTAYKKFSYRTEVHYNILMNEFVSLNNLYLPIVKNSYLSSSFDGFSAVVFKKIATFHVYAFLVNKIKNIAKISKSLEGFRGAHYHSFQIGARPIFNFIHSFGAK
jgi:hypothetical protein